MDHIGEKMFQNVDYKYTGSYATLNITATDCFTLASFT